MLQALKKPKGFVKPGHLPNSVVMWMCHRQVRSHFSEELNAQLQLCLIHCMKIRFLRKFSYIFYPSISSKIFYLLPCDSNYILTQLVIPLSLISFENFTYMWYTWTISDIYMEQRERLCRIFLKHGKNFVKSVNLTLLNLLNLSASVLNASTERGISIPALNELTVF